MFAGIFMELHGTSGPGRGDMPHPVSQRSNASAEQTSDRAKRFPPQPYHHLQTVFVSPAISLDSMQQIRQGERISSRDLCDRLSRTRDLSQRQISPGIMIMRSRPANIRLINRRSNLSRPLPALCLTNGKGNGNIAAIEMVIHIRYLTACLCAISRAPILATCSVARLGWHKPEGATSGGQKPSGRPYPNRSQAAG